MVQNKAVVVGMEEGIQNGRVVLRGGDRKRQKIGFISSPTIPAASAATKPVLLSTSLNSSFSRFLAGYEY